MRLDPLSSADRADLLARPRPHPALPIVEGAPVVVPGLAPAPGALPRPSYAVWEATLQCDQTCRHCGSRAGPRRRDELSTAEGLDLIGQLQDLGVKEITLIGGEAYLRPDWLELVAEIHRRKMRCTMTTGGKNFTPERARGAKAAGMDAVSVSIDGLEATHDRLRGADGSYAAAMRALAAGAEAGMPMTANTQINRLSMPELPEVARRLYAAGVRSWQIQLTVPMGRAADEPEVLLQPPDLLRLFPMLADLAENSGLTIWPANNVGYFGPYEHILRKVQPGRHMVSCSAGTHSIGIESDGTIKGCPSLPTADWASGNFRHHSLREIWARAAPLRYTRERTVDDLWGFCRTCYYASTCKAGCTWTSDVFFGRPGNNPYCHHRALEHERLGKSERLVQVESAQRRPFDRGRFEIEVR